MEELREEFHKTLLRLLPPVPLSQLLVHAVDAVRIDFADYREALVAAEDAERVVELLKSLGPASRNDTLPSKESVLLGRWSSSKTVETGRGVDVQVELRGALIRFLKESSVSRAAFSSGAVLLVGDAKSAARCGAAPPVGHTVSASSSSAALPAGDAMSASSSSAAPHALSATGSYSGYTDSFDVQSGSVERCNVCVDFQRGSACPRCNWSSGNTDSFDAQSGVEVEKAPVDPRTLAEAHRAVQESKPVPRLRMSGKRPAAPGIPPELALVIQKLHSGDHMSIREKTPWLKQAGCKPNRRHGGKYVHPARGLTIWEMEHAALERLRAQLAFDVECRAGYTGPDLIFRCLRRWRGVRSVKSCALSHLLAVTFDTSLCLIGMDSMYCADWPNWRLELF